jgi:hypothetical protein
MIYFKTYEEFGTYLPTPYDSPKISSFAQQTPNGLAGTYDNTMASSDTALDNDFKKVSRDMNPDNEMKIPVKRKRKIRRKFDKKLKEYKRKF